MVSYKCRDIGLPSISLLLIEMDWKSHPAILSDLGCWVTATKKQLFFIWVLLLKN
jgi:hypothetical protein